MSELWGFTSGIQQGQEANTKQQLAQLSIQEGTVDIAQKNLNLKASEMALTQQQSMMRQMAAAASGPAGSSPHTNMADMMANQLYGRAEILLAGGSIEEAAKVASQAGELQVHAHEIEKAEGEKNHKLWTDVADALGQVKDDASWKQAQMAFALEHPDEANLPNVQQMFAKPFDAGAVAKMRDAALSQKDQAATKASNARAGADTARTKVAESEVPLNQARTREADARAAALKKAGGKPDELPKASDINFVMHLAQTQFDLDSADANSPEIGKAKDTATRVADAAKDVQTANPGMSRREALTIAFKSSVAKTQWAGLKPKDTTIGSSSARPMAAPKGLVGLQDNKWYLVQDGKGNAVPQYYSNGVFKTAQAMIDDPDDAPAKDPDDTDDDE